MTTPSLFTRAVLAPVAAASLLALATGCNSPGPHPQQSTAATTPTDPKDGVHMKRSPAPHPQAQRAKRRHHHPAPSDEPMVGSPGPHPVNGAPTPTPAPGQ